LYKGGDLEQPFPQHPIDSLFVSGAKEKESTIVVTGGILPAETLVQGA
jgi:hypothetical protein